MSTDLKASQNNPVNVHSTREDAERWATHCNRPDNNGGWSYVAKPHEIELADGSKLASWAVNAYRAAREVRQ